MKLHRLIKKVKPTSSNEELVSIHTKILFIVGTKPLSKDVQLSAYDTFNSIEVLLRVNNHNTNKFKTKLL